jgi:(p)ppGpp synthase/HD superfamily hydrolase
MEEMPNTMDALTTQVRDLRLHGYSFEEISTKMGVRVEEVVAAWKDFIESRTQMPPEEQWVLHLLRLERLLVLVNDRLAYATRAEDFEVVLKLLDRLAALQALNLDMKKDADGKLAAITRAQTALILQALFAINTGVKAHIEAAFAQHKTIKAIKGEVLGENFTTVFQAEAQRVLTEGVTES